MARGMDRRLDEILGTDRACVTIGTRSRATSAMARRNGWSLGLLVMQDPAVLLLDEPTAGMTAAETTRTANIIKGLRGSHIRSSWSNTTWLSCVRSRRRSPSCTWARSWPRATSRRSRPIPQVRAAIPGFEGYSLMLTLGQRGCVLRQEPRAASGLDRGAEAPDHHCAGTQRGGQDNAAEDADGPDGAGQRRHSPRRRGHHQDARAPAGAGPASPMCRRGGRSSRTSPFARTS